MDNEFNYFLNFLGLIFQEDAVTTRLRTYLLWGYSSPLYLEPGHVAQRSATFICLKREHDSVVWQLWTSARSGEILLTVYGKYINMPGNRDQESLLPVEYSSQ